ncbi:hypothetical protein B0H10DRAFT_503073 [Mycena sp. CBHHK59/15]|nr:hypothetical protein B0H10DRAFT_503073 [Mycena sp. CBHHK59/15]
MHVVMSHARPQQAKAIAIRVHTILLALTWTVSCRFRDCSSAAGLKGPNLVSMSSVAAIGARASVPHGTRPGGVMGGRRNLSLASSSGDDLGPECC